MSKTKTQTCEPSINVTPLIDVLLVLLIIFMVIQPRREMKLPVRAPQPAPEGAPASPRTLMLTVSDGADLQLNRRRVQRGELPAMLASLMEDRREEDRALFIKAPAHFPHQSIVDLIDTAKRSGVVTVGLLADDGPR